MALKHRSFTTEFKKELVEQIIYRAIPVSALSRQHDIARPVLYRWIREYQDGGIKELRGCHSNKPSIEDLEALVGRLMVDNTLLKKALEAVRTQHKPNEIISGAAEISLEQ